MWDQKLTRKLADDRKPGEPIATLGVWKRGTDRKTLDVVNHVLGMELRMFLNARLLWSRVFHESAELIVEARHRAGARELGLDERSRRDLAPGMGVFARCVPTVSEFATAPASEIANDEQ
jgi:hypothetical protein